MDYSVKTGQYSNIAQQYAEKKLRGRLLEHVFACAETGEKLARKFDCSEDKAAAACYLHDIAKALPYPEQVAYGRRLGMSRKEIESFLPPILHGPVAARITKKELLIDDAEIIEAIECHSTGCAGMRQLAKIVFIADYIEFTRAFPGAKELRSHGAVTLDELAAAILARKITHLLEERRPIDSRAFEFWNDLTYSKR
jgi:predicted HD superfamily hydrolase involved in NAD metabolism